MAATTGSATWRRPSAPRSSLACAWASGVRSGRQDPADWVLDPFGAAERQNLGILVADAADAVEQLIDEGLVAAQQKHHAPR